VQSAEPYAEGGVPAFLAHDGELARLIAARDWSDSLGPIADWPASLRTAVGLMIHSPVPMVLLWGEDGIMIYNDPYSVVAGGRHPQLLGSKVREGWPEVAEFNDNVMRVGLAGGALAYKDQELTLHRSGQPEPVWMNLDYSPVIDESGRPGGVIAIVVETTQRVLAERRQAALTSRLRRQFEQSPGFVIIMTGANHLVEFVNERHRQVFGSHDWVGKTIRAAFPSLEGQGFFEALDRVFVTGEAIQFEAVPVRYQRSPGAPQEERRLTFIYAPIHDDTGAVTGIFCDGFDMSETYGDRRRREALVRLSDELRDIDDPEHIAAAAGRVLGELLDASRVGYGAIDADSDTLHVYSDWTAKGADTVAGVTNLRAYGSFIDSLKRGELVTIADVRQDPRTAAAVAALDRRRALSLVNVPVMEHGRLVAMLFVNDALERVWSDADQALIREFADRTRTAVERARTQAALAASEARLRFLDDLGRQTAKSVDADDILAITTRMVGEHLDVSVCAYADMDDDEDGFTIRGDWAAPGSQSIVGHYSLGDFGAMAVKNLGAGEPLIINNVHVDIAPEEAATFQAIGISATICMPLVKEGRLTALMAIHDKAPRQWTAAELAMIREVTDRSWAHVERVGSEAELRASAAALADLNATLEHRVQERTSQLMQVEEALRQSQKMEAVGQLTGGIAHDFNNLLAGISGSLELLERRLGEGQIAGLERYIDAAQGAARRAAALTQRLLAFSRRQTLDPKSVDVNRLVAGMEDLVRRSVGPTIELEVVGAGGLWTTRVDPSQLENAILNLCINARDSMAPEGGRLTIETANKWLDERAARERDLPAGQYVSLCITDTGVGMSAEVMQRAFDPFFTTKPLGQGTGLGLSMVYGFARQSGGQVRIYSEVGKGTTMCLYLPRHMGEQEPEALDALVAGTPGYGETVLVIDDEPIVRMLIVDVLEEAGYAALEAGEGAGGLKVLQSDVRIDLLITDVGLPGGMNGRQVADAARVLRPDLKVLFITGYAENAVVGNGHLDPGMEVITKPFSTVALSAKIREMIDGR
jgi:signal transduction histidine kinase/CheY-like chemotaxis protein/PAS domain-containing protein